MTLVPFFLFGLFSSHCFLHTDIATIQVFFRPRFCNAQHRALPRFIDARILVEEVKALSGSEYGDHPMRDCERCCVEES